MSETRGERQPMICSSNTRVRTLALSLAVAVSGCASTSSEPESLPGWVDNPPKSSSTTLYGVGESVNRQAAQRLALEDIAGQISTQIASESTFQTTQSGTDARSNARSRVESQVEDISLSHFQTQEVHRREGRLFALVELDRRAFTRDMEEEAQELHEDLASSLEDEGITDFRRLARFAQSEADIQALDRKAQILRSFDSPVGDTMRDAVQGFSSQRDQLLASLQLEIVYNDHVSRRVAESLRNAFVDFGLSASVTEDGASSGDRVIVQTDQQIDQSFDSYMASVNAEIALIDQAGHELSRIQTGYNASSMSGADNALQNAINKLESAVNRRGVFSYLQS